MKYLRNGKDRGSAAELRHHAEDLEETLPSDNPSYSYNPFADTDPFSPAQSTSSEQVVEAIVREHAAGAPSFGQEQGPSQGEVGRQSPAGLHEVALHDWASPAGTGDTAGGRNGVGGYGEGLHSTQASRDYVAATAGAGKKGQPQPGTPSSWAKGGSPRAAEAYELATPSPRAPAYRQSGASQGAAAAWDVPALPGAKRGLRLWGRKEASAPSPPLPLSHPPSFGAMLPPPGASAGARVNGGGRRSSSSAAAVADGALPAQAAALERRDRELSRREADIARREAALNRAGGTRVKNWPRCYPILHHDIAAEVPAGRQRLVGAGYLTCILVCIAYLYNWLLITIMFGCGEKSVSIWLFASLVAMSGVPLPFYCWYRMLYFAAITDGAARWAWFFINMAVNIFWNWWMFVGVEPKLGGYSAGVFTMIEQFTHGGGRGTAFGVLSIVNMVLWGLGGLLSIFVLGWAVRIFRGRDQAGYPGATAAPPAGVFR